MMQADDCQLIRCKRDGCGQVLAHFTNEARNEFEIDAARTTVDRQGRTIVRCPACGSVNRFYTAGKVRG